jgi:phosphoribosylaminoimidazole-succinocarboxamide synthase
MATEAVVSSVEPLIRTTLSLPDRREGKVRDIYRVPAQRGGPPRLLIVATDRISAFDVVLATPIPGKGRLLCDISLRWFHFVRELRLIGDHLLSSDPGELPELTPQQRARLEGRIMIGRAAEVIPVEFVVRGYLAGSGWQEYQRTGSVCGVPLPAGLRQCQKLPRPVLTPTTKSRGGHDEPLDFRQACALAGAETVRRLRDVSIAIYDAAAAYALARRTILADTKFEFGRALDDHGRATDETILIDEVLTPDSSRYWPADSYEPGREQESFDKQYVRNYLQGLVDRGRWDKTPPGPPLPEEVVANTLRRYTEVRDRLFGR